MSASSYAWTKPTLMVELISKERKICHDLTYHDGETLEQITSKIASQLAIQDQIDSQSSMECYSMDLDSWVDVDNAVQILQSDKIRLHMKVKATTPTSFAGTKKFNALSVQEQHDYLLKALVSHSKEKVIYIFVGVMQV
jgi:hypothetical protein